MFLYSDVLKGKSCPRIPGRILHEHAAGFMEDHLGNLAASQNDRAYFLSSLICYVSSLQCTLIKICILFISMAGGRSLVSVIEVQLQQLWVLDDERGLLVHRV